MTTAERSLRHLLQQIRAAARNGRPGLRYTCAADFALQHGQWYAPAPHPYRERGAPKCCYGNALMLAVKYPELRYVEGYAMPSFVAMPLQHAWNVTPDGGLVDITWWPLGTAYLGVEFALERADDATWNGDASILDDWKRGWPLFREPWTGERSWADYVPSEPLALAQRLARRGQLLTREVGR